MIPQMACVHGSFQSSGVRAPSSEQRSGNPCKQQAGLGWWVDAKALAVINEVITKCT